MKLPDQIFSRMLELIAMNGFEQSTARSYGQRLNTIRKDMKKLSADFATGKPSETQYSDAYLLYNFPMNLAKTKVVVERLGLYYPQLFSGWGRIDVLDIGCGSGAGIIGSYYALSDVPGIKQFKFTGIDSSHRMLTQARVLVQWLAAHDRRVQKRFLNKKIADVYSLSGRKKYDLVLCINSLAEIAEDDKSAMHFVSSALHRLNRGGLFIVIEPALKKFSRRLMVLRDRLITDKRIQILLPCLYDKPCGLLQAENRNEWCHQSVPWKPPGFLQAVNKGINREIDVLKFSYLAIAKTADRLKRPRGYLVISHLLKEKGKKRCFICTGSGRVELVRLNRAANEKNACFEDISKGTIVEVADIARKKSNYWQVTEDSTVEIVK
jgi:ribosomal protein RSM22 (predicted rRNA methylase)